MNTRSARALRGGTFALLATLAAAASHTLAGGGAPSPLFCAVIAALAAPGATALAGARPALWRTALAVGGSQMLFHAAFTVTGDPGTWDAAATHVHGAPVLGESATTVVSAGGGAVMTAAHLAAAMVTILAVARGEHVLRAVVHWLPRILPRRSTTLPDIPVPRLVRGSFDAAFVVRRLYRAGSVSRRGPPPHPLASILPA